MTSRWSSSSPRPDGEGGAPESVRGLPWRQFLYEGIGTALLLLVGLSMVIVMFGADGPVLPVVPEEGVRRAIAGALFGATGGLIALSPVGRVSGAHVNPAVTLAFWLMGRIDGRVALGYALSQVAGAVLGCLPLLAWGDTGRSVAFGATLPGAGYPCWAVPLGEAAATFALVAGLCVFIGFRRLRPFTPVLLPFLYGFLVYAEAPLSGTSTNPARSFGPAVVSGHWEGWWIYWAGPLAGTLAATLACSYLAKRIEVAKLYYFDSDRDGLFRRMGRSGYVER